MNANNSLSCRDELFLAVRYLSLMGMSRMRLSQLYGLSRTKLNDIAHGKGICSNRRKYECALMLALCDVRDKAIRCSGRVITGCRPFSEEEIREVIIEYARVHFGLPHDARIWREIE